MQKYKRKTLLLVLLALTVIAGITQRSNERIILGEQNAKKAIRYAILDKNYKPFYDTLIKDNHTAIAVVEPILFKIYGKEQITNERPYECYLIDCYWYISGTLPKGSLGGVFEVIVSAKDGMIIKLTHGK